MTRTIVNRKLTYDEVLALGRLLDKNYTKPEGAAYFVWEKGWDDRRLVGEINAPGVTEPVVKRFRRERFGDTKASRGSTSGLAGSVYTRLTTAEKELAALREANTRLYGQVTDLIASHQTSSELNVSLLRRLTTLESELGVKPALSIVGNEGDPLFAERKA